MVFMISSKLLKKLKELDFEELEEDLENDKGPYIAS